MRLSRAFVVDIGNRKIGCGVVYRIGQVELEALIIDIPMTCLDIRTCFGERGRGGLGGEHPRYFQDNGVFLRPATLAYNMHSTNYVDFPIPIAS